MSKPILKMTINRQNGMVRVLAPDGTLLYAGLDGLDIKEWAVGYMELHGDADFITEWTDEVSG